VIFKAVSLGSNKIEGLLERNQSVPVPNFRSKVHASAIGSTQEPNIIALKSVNPEVQLTGIKVGKITVYVCEMFSSFYVRDVIYGLEALPKFGVKDHGVKPMCPPSLRLNEASLDSFKAETLV
tara:strand:- start:1465 stop:1833 length:369 start_codon:yes stop_codon:yes gene_type:complete